MDRQKRSWLKNIRTQRYGIKYVEFSCYKNNFIFLCCVRKLFTKKKENIKNAKLVHYQ